MHAPRKSTAASRNTLFPINKLLNSPSEQRAEKRYNIDTSKNKNRRPNIYIVGKETVGNRNIKTVARKFHFIMRNIAINTDSS